MDQVIAKGHFNIQKEIIEPQIKDQVYILKKHQKIMVELIETMFHHLEAALAVMLDQMNEQVRPHREQINPLWEKI